MVLNKNIEKNIRIMFPENAEDRTQRILKRLRDDKSKDEHVPGSLTWIGRCAVDHAAADLIEQLESQIPRWISVEERLPEDGVDVVIRYGKDGFCEVASRSGENWHCAEYVVLGSEWITHWMPLPEPPEVEHETVHDCNS